MKNPEKCLETCKLAKEIAIENFSDYSLKARIYQRMGSAYMLLQQYDEAIEVFNDSLLENKTDVVKELLFKAQKTKKKYDEEQYLNPELAEQLKEEGNELFKEKNFPEAIKK